MGTPVTFKKQSMQKLKIEYKLLEPYRQHIHILREIEGM